MFPLSTFCDRSYATTETLRTVFGCEFPRTVAPEDVLFLDTETTGLSGGAGTIAFQVGLGYFAPAGFVVEQFLMRDYPDEEAMLDLLAARMKRFSVLCTFNGKTFDVPLLKTRFLMHRIRDDGIPICHADVLFHRPPPVEAAAETVQSWHAGNGAARAWSGKTIFPAHWCPKPIFNI